MSTSFAVLAGPHPRSWPRLDSQTRSARRAVGAHPAGADERQNLVGPETDTWRKAHDRAGLCHARRALLAAECDERIDAGRAAGRAECGHEPCHERGRGDDQ